MEHITIEKLSGDYIKLTPDKGYILIDNRSQREYSEAIIKSNLKRFFKAIKK